MSVKAGFNAVFLMKRPIGSPVNPKLISSVGLQDLVGFVASIPSRGSHPLCIGILEAVELVVKGFRRGIQRDEEMSL